MTKDEYEDMLEIFLEAWETRIALIEAKLYGRGARALPEIERELEFVCRKGYEISVQLAEIRAHNDHEWSDLNDCIAHAWADIDERLHSLIGRVNYGQAHLH